jgi:predicted NUDIX family NTP pyrophosphohydrolase
MARISAGILLFRRTPGLEVLLVHPGGPFWAKKDLGAWTIPKGLANEGEDLLLAAKREFHEETGLRPDGSFTALGSFRQPGGKIIAVWALEGAFDPASLTSNSFAMEWPPRSGKTAEFPEVDRAAWFGAEEALARITKGQAGIIGKLAETLGVPMPVPRPGL